MSCADIQRKSILYEENTVQKWEACSSEIDAEFYWIPLLYLCISALFLFCFVFWGFVLFLAAPHGLRDLSSLTRGPGIEPMPPAVEARSPNHWSAREFPLYFYFDQWIWLYYKILVLNHPHFFGMTLTCLWFVLCQVLGCLHKNFVCFPFLYVLSNCFEYH